MPDRPILPDAQWDPLGGALHHLHMSGAFYCHSELTAPWGMTLPPLPGHVWFHVVAGGEMEVGGERRLRRADVALVTTGDGHVLRSEPGVAVPNILDLEREHVSERYEILRHGGGGAPTRLLCGAMHFDHPVARNLIAALPAFIHVEATDDGADTLHATLALIAAELRRPRPGGEAIITRLADVLVIQAIRAWMDTGAIGRTGWLGAMRDPHLGRALALIHAEPARDWTVAALAGELAMSRSAFAARFSELVGMPAMQYVTDWRMQVAGTALAQEGATIASVASQLGYRSEAAFARAFKRVTGTPPGAVRARGPRGGGGMRTVYVAGPLGFSPATRGYHDDVLLPAVRAAGLEPLDPWADPDAQAELAAADALDGREERAAAFRRVNERLAAANEAMLRRCDAVLAVLDGVDVDSGTAAEIGFAAALGTPVVGLRLDVRRTGDNEGAVVNLQVEHWLVAVEHDVGAAIAAVASRA